MTRDREGCGRAFVIQLDFLVDAFGFTVIDAFRDDRGNVLHAQLSTGDGVVLIGPEIAEVGARAVADPAWATQQWIFATPR